MGLQLVRAGSAFAAEPAREPPVNEDADWLTQSREILDHSAEAPPPPWLRRAPNADAASTADLIAGKAIDRSASAPPAVVPGRILIFASFSIPPTTLKSLLQQASEPDVVLVLRGVPSGATVPQVVRRLKQVLSDAEPVPHVVLDPTLFHRYGVEEVPTLVLERGSAQKPIVVVGAVTSDWLRRMAPSVQPGQEHLGTRAEHYAIAEADLIEEMQQRLARIDWTERRRAAVERFWRARAGSFVELPDAREMREFSVDPSVRVTEDIEDAEGNVLVRAGETFNPLAWVPLSKTLIVFRGTDPRHVARARELAREAMAHGYGVILLTTAIETERGWERLSELERALSGTVYVLPPVLVERFHLQNIPATVSSRGKQLLVTEVPVEKGS